MPPLHPARPQPGRAPAPPLPFSDDTSVRDILRRWPATREVFDRAGLMGCGGEQGPDEPLAFFASVHHVPLEPLKRSLAGAIQPAAPGARRELRVAPAAPLAFEAVHRYKPFLLTSLALTLTFGATLGMINLARLTTPWFGGLATGAIRAHAFVQVFGFVGLFVIGIALHVLPRFAARPLWRPALVPVVLGLQSGGVLAIAGAFLLRDDAFRWIWVAGSLALVAAAMLFASVVARTLAGLDSPERFARWVVAGAAWQVAAAGLSVVAAWRHDV